MDTELLGSILIAYKKLRKEFYQLRKELRTVYDNTKKNIRMEIRKEIAREKMNDEMNDEIKKKCNEKTAVRKRGRGVAEVKGSINKCMNEWERGEEKSQNGNENERQFDCREGASSKYECKQSKRQFDYGENGN